MVFPTEYLLLPIRRFPIKFRAAMSPYAIPDCHLVRTVILRLPYKRQPRCFPPQARRLLASFANMVSTGYHFRPRPWPNLLNSHIRHAHSRQATLHTASKHTAMQVYTCIVLGPLKPTWDIGLAQLQVSTATGSAFICHYEAPSNLNPQHPP